ncbi:hypothetical protein CCR80_14025 [Rhodothalassium salexigens]|uniref:C39 family peptidase n=1 Tax=Rhodothalassium salexigens TaxID=1086 RepID=UPI0019140BA8|nr:C39 family peptidase [Rhodothalassium salexigens]MBK5922154.1 hypothetical protein [Rhodothalassium salexigens]
MADRSHRTGAARPALAALAAWSALAVAGGVAGTVAAIAMPPVSLPGGTNTRLSITVKSYTERRFEDVVRQRYDLSCGAAALATVLRHYWGMTVTEQSIIDGIFEHLDEPTRAMVSRAGFSMLELKQAAERLGLAAGGYRLDDVSKLAELEVPAITLTNIRGYAHFAVVRSVQGDAVYIADPAFGNRVRTLRQFDREWNGVILVTVSRTRVGAAGFRVKAGAVTPTRELVVLTNRVLRTITPLGGEF